jgi:hypothetical protein
MDNTPGNLPQGFIGKILTVDLIQKDAPRIL